MKTRLEPVAATAAANDLRHRPVESRTRLAFQYRLNTTDEPEEGIVNARFETADEGRVFERA